MTDTGPDERPPTPFALKVGLAFWAVAIVWWFLYYGQYGGYFRLLGLKLACLGWPTRECAFFQQNIRGPVPLYLPVFWYGGMIAFTVGVWQQWKGRR